MIETAKEAKEKIRKREIDNLIVEVITTKKKAYEVHKELEQLEIDMKKDINTTHEVINVVRGMNRDLLLALENLIRIRRILFNKRE